MEATVLVLSLLMMILAALMHIGWQLRRLITATEKLHDQRQGRGSQELVSS